MAKAGNNASIGVLVGNATDLFRANEAGGSDGYPVAGFKVKNNASAGVLMVGVAPLNADPKETPAGAAYHPVQPNGGEVEFVGRSVTGRGTINRVFAFYAASPTGNSVDFGVTQH